MEKTVELEIPLLLPGVDGDQDACLARLEASLCGRKGIVRAHLEREKSPVDLCLHYDPNLLSLADVTRLAERAGAQITNRFHHDSLAIEGMDCSDCARVLEHSVGRVDGVLSVQVNYASERMWVEYDNQRVNRHAIEQRVRSMGYAIPLSPAQERLRENRQLLLSLLAGLSLAAGWLGGRLLGFPVTLSTGFYLGAYLLGGWDTTRHAFHALREGHFDTDLLMVLAALGAAVLGEFADGGLLLFLFSLGDALEDRALGRARKSVEALGELTPKTALVRREGEEVEVPVESLRLDEQAIVRPGVRIPVDGVILKGSSAVDQSPVTGESLPVEKAPGDTVFAGTINGEGALEVRVTRLAKDSTLARVMKMVEEAQAQKSPTQTAVEKFERVFVPAVLGLTVLVIAVPPLLGLPFRESFLRAMTLLVAASPCALALGTPAAVLSGIAQAARNGVLIKGGAYLENLGQVKAIAFDKTGTVTHGRPEVTDILAWGVSVKELLSLGAGAESRSAHPLAQAIVRKARASGVQARPADAVESLAGHGLRAQAGGRIFWLGNQDLMKSKNVALPAEMIAQAQRLQAAGKSVIWVGTQGESLGLIALADTIRPEAAQTMRELARSGVAHTILLSGDNAQAAAAIAREAGISDFRARLLPEDKLVAIRGLVGKYGQVAMVGDGVNDAPALANATVGIAMGGSSTDVALETADVALMGDDLSRLPFALRLGRASRAIILQNLILSLGVIAVLVGASLAGAVGMGVAVVVHESATILVVLNALRLLGFK
jgi:Cd2+/Zn2+-exporting ATPase